MVDGLNKRDTLSLGMRLGDTHLTPMSSSSQQCGCSLERLTPCQILEFAERLKAEEGGFFTLGRLGILLLCPF